MIYKARNRISAIESDDMIKELQNVLDRSEDITIDMSRTEYISSEGIRVLTQFMEKFKHKRCEFSIINISDNIKDTLIQNGLNDSEER